MRGGAGQEEGLEEDQQHQPSAPPLLPPLQQGGATKSPPLSAAPSQVSLAPSDLTTSDPDLSQPSCPPSLGSSSVSLSSNSRPPSSSSGLASPDLAPHPATDISDAVEEEEEAQEDETPPLPVGGSGSPSPSDDHQNFTEEDFSNGGSEQLEKELNGPSSLGPTPVKGREAALKHESLMMVDGPGSDVEEDYFEEYHLPNTHENAFVRHRSFRRKVELTPINAPDAEKIEGLVRTGEYERHGSMRRKIVATEAGLYKLEEDGSSESELLPSQEEEVGSRVHEFSEDFREIEKMMDDTAEDEGNLVADKLSAEKLLTAASVADSANGGCADIDTPKLLMRGKNAYTSTPNNLYASTADYASIDLSASLHDTSARGDTTAEYESMSIEQSTLNKVRECMDFSKTKDMYNLTGKLQDILTAVEVEEVLNNSHRYVDCIDSGVLQALFNSISEQMSLTGQPMSISFNKPDVSKTVEDEKELTLEEVELKNKIKQKLLMEELAMDSLPYINADTSGGVYGEEERFRVVAPSSDFEEPPVVMREKRSSMDSSDGESSSRFGTIERRKSVRVSNANHSQREVEGVFIESDFKNDKLKTISAPTIDLVNSESKDDDDFDITDDFDTDLTLSKQQSHPLQEGVDGGLAVHDVPSILITRTDSSREEDNSSVNNLFVDESSAEQTSIHGTCRPASRGEDSRRGSLTDSSDGERNGNEDPLSRSPPQRQSADSIRCSPAVAPPPPPPQFVADAEEEEERHWRSVVIGGVWRRIDMKVIAPYIKCISPGGHHGSHAVVVVSACQLPERNTTHYSYVMDNLFLYLLSRLEQLVAEDYILVYLSGGRNVANTGPSFHWLKAAYQMIDRKLRKNLQALLVVHPTLWVRTIVALTRPFISSKFYRKLTFVYSLTELAQLIPLDQLSIPDCVKEADFELMIREKKKNVGRRQRPRALLR